MVAVAERGQKEQTSARLDRDLKRRLQALADKQRRSFSSMLEIVIEEFLERHEADDDESTRRAHPRR